MQNKDDYYSVGTLTEDTLRKLEESGLRMTVQRRHIIDILTNSECTSPKELWYEAREFVPDLGIATVYRLINRLEQIGVLHKQRTLGMRPEVPELGTIHSGKGKRVYKTQGADLTELIRLGMISRGIIGPNNAIQLSLSGNKVNITVIK